MTVQSRAWNDAYGPWLVAGGLLGALSQPFLGFIGTIAALGCAFVLALRGHRLPALALAAVTGLLLLAFLLFVGVMGAQVEFGGDIAD